MSEEGATRKSPNFCLNCDSRFGVIITNEDDDYKYYRCTRCREEWRHPAKKLSKKEKSQSLSSKCDNIPPSPSGVPSFESTDATLDIKNIGAKLIEGAIEKGKEDDVIDELEKVDGKKINQPETVWQYEALKENTEKFLEILGADITGDQFRDTPRRVAKAWLEMTAGYRKPDFNMTTFKSDYNGILYRKGIPFTSLCAHHLQPFTGTIDFGYIPDGQIIGISKIIRYCQYVAAKMTVQEELTTEILQGFTKIVKPKGCIVIIEAFHSCESNRGVKVSGVSTGTSQRNGLFETIPLLEEKFYTLIGRR